MGFPGDSDGKELYCDAGYAGSIPGSGRSPGEENGYPLQYAWGFPGGSDHKKYICAHTVHGKEMSTAANYYHRHHQ